MATIIDSFDLDAAGVRRATGDLRAFSNALAARLEGALPERVVVRRVRDGLFSKESHVAQIEVRGERAVYHLAFAHGGVTATRAKSVRGVVISTAPVSVPEWLAGVREEAQALADAGGSAVDVLHGFL